MPENARFEPRIYEIIRQTVLFRGLNPAQVEQVLKQARPPVFFKRQRVVQAQLRSWSLSDLVTAGGTLNANVLAARRNAALAEAIAGRCRPFPGAVRWIGGCVGPDH
mgnify:CR=1 FL=1